MARKRDAGKMETVGNGRAGDARGRDVVERERTDDAQAMLAAIVESSDDAIIGKTLDGVITSWNRAAELLYGYTADEAIGRPIEIIVPEDRRGELRDILSRVKRGERIEHHETVRVARDSRRVDVSVTISPIMDHAGYIVGASTIARDISGRRHAEEALRGSERNHARAQAISHIGNWYLDPVTEVGSGSEEFFRILGVPRQEAFPYSEWFKLVHPDDRARARDIFDRNKNAHIQEDFEFRIIRPDGEERVIFVTGEYAPGEDGKPRLIGTMQDITERKRAEEALRENERYLESIFEGIQEGISILDKDMNIVKANHAMKKWYSHMLPLEGKKCYKAYQGLTSPCDDCPSLRAMRERTMQTSVVPYVNRSGRAGWMELYSSPLLDDHGEVVGVIEHVRDITERRRAEEALNKNLVVLTKSQEIARLGSWTLDFDSGRFEISDEMYRIHGFEPGAIEPTLDQSTKLTHPEDLETYREYIESIRREGRRDSIDYRVVWRDGSIHYMHAQTDSVARGPDGCVKTASGITQDITERKRAEEALRSSQSMLKSVMGNVPLAIFWKDRNSTYLGCNDVFARAVGLGSPEEIVGRTDFDLPWLPEHTASFREYDRRIMENDTPEYHIVEQYRDANGKLRWAETNKIPLHDAQGHVIGVLCTYQDITERKQAEKELEEAKAQAELYLDLMGHDINNMNQSAQGFLELALQTLDMDGKIGMDGRVLIEKPLQAVQGSSRLISNVRKLQRLSEEGVKTRPVDLHDLFVELRSLDFHVGDRDATINVQEVPHRLVEGSDLLQDVFFNLVSNAVKHSRPDMPVTVDVRAERVELDGRAYYRCTVEDDGPGVADGLKPRLFHRFQRGKTQAHGRGLGLYLVRTLVEGYGGKVWVEDRVKGDHAQGARFVIMLPSAK